MTTFAWLLVFLFAGCLLLAIACQLDAMEIRWERRNRERAERWEADRRGEAKVEDFKQWRKDKEDANRG